MSIERFQLQDILWPEAIDQNRLWSPVELSPLSYLPSFGLLSETAQLRYNHLFAIGVCEQFIWFENDLLKPILINTLRKKLPTLKTIENELGEFIEDEVKHSEMFWQLLERAAPEWYASRKYQLLNLGPFQKCSIFAMTKATGQLLVWIWAALFFEERTLDYSRKYRSLNRADPEKLDIAFARIHLLHLQDEARHHDLDQRLLKVLYEEAPKWKRYLSGKMMYRLIKSFASPRRVSLRILNILSAEFPDEVGTCASLRKELPLLANHKKFHAVAFGQKSVGTSRKFFERYPEMHPVLSLFKDRDE